MGISFFCNKYLIFLLAFFTPMIINIGGEVSPSFLFILSTFIYWQKYLDFKKDRILKSFIKPFFIIIGIQIIWALFAETNFLTQLKGILITISGLLFFLYYYMVYKHNINVIKWGVLGTFTASFFFINILAEIAGGEFGMWKFQIYPRIVSGSILIYLWLCNKKWMQNIGPLILIGIGMLGLTTGARSSGLTPLIAGTLVFILTRNTYLSQKKIRFYALLGIYSIYGIYALIYVPGAINGTFSGGNTKQIKSLKNPYNPFNLIMMGRSDAVVPFIAFFDNPITGWGWSTDDPNWKYHKLIGSLRNDTKSIIEKDQALRKTIPGHSVWGYYSCSYGIIVFIAFLLIITKTWKLVYHSFISHDKYILYRVYCCIGITWNFLFSPTAHFKWLPATLALVIVLSTKALTSYKKYLHTKHRISIK